MKAGIAISRRLAMLAAAGLAGLAMTGGALAQSTLDEAREAGFIRIGFANEAPYGYATPDGKLTGEAPERSEENTSDLQSLMRISYAVCCLTKKKYTHKD